MTSEEKLRHYLDLSYPIEIVEEKGAVTASIPDLPGCNSFGENVSDALRSLRQTKELWLKGRLDAGQPIPKPSVAEEYSGKFVLRIPKVLHHTLDREAKQQGISLNQYILYLLSERHTLVLIHGGAGGSLRLGRGGESGETRMNRGDTRISTLRAAYGEHFARGYRGDTRLETLLKREGAQTLSEYLKKADKDSRVGATRRSPVTRGRSS
jgi:predicted HicB family RNase H-like nuclease